MALDQFYVWAQEEQLHDPSRKGGKMFSSHLSSRLLSLLSHNLPNAGMTETEERIIAKLHPRINN